MEKAGPARSDRRLAQAEASRAHKLPPADAIVSATAWLRAETFLPELDIMGWSGRPGWEGPPIRQVEAGTGSAAVAVWVGCDAGARATSLI